MAQRVALFEAGNSWTHAVCICLTENVTHVVDKHGTKYFQLSVVRALELYTPWRHMSSSLSSLRGCGPPAALDATQPATRYTTSPGQLHSSKTLDSDFWRKQVCEVRPSRSSTLGRFPADGRRVSADDDQETTTAVPRVDSVSLLSVTVTKSTEQGPQRPRVPRPPPRWSSDCSRCRWLRVTSEQGRGRDTVPRRKILDDVEDQERTSYGNTVLPPPPPPPSATSQITSSTSSVTSPLTVQDLCIQGKDADIQSVGSSSANSCLLHAGGGAHLRTTDLARCCLENIRELDETSTIVEDLLTADSHKTVTADDRRRLATTCTVTTFV